MAIEKLVKEKSDEQKEKKGLSDIPFYIQAVNPDNLYLVYEPIQLPQTKLSPWKNYGINVSNKYASSKDIYGKELKPQYSTQKVSYKIRLIKIKPKRKKYLLSTEVEELVNAHIL